MKSYYLADYATFKILSALDPNSEGFTPKSRYYKAIYLLDYNLKRKHKIDIQLPWRWYIYGPIIELDCIERSVYRLDPQTGGVDDEFRSKLMFGDEPTADAPVEVIRAVDYEARQICEPYPSIMDLVDKSYETAELPFIRTLRKYDDGIRSNFQHFPNDPRALLKCDDLRMELSRHYPSKRYSEMHGAFLRILELIRKVKDQQSNELINPIECSFKARWALANGFSRDFHGALPDRKISYILKDYEAASDSIEEIAFQKEVTVYNATPKKTLESYQSELKRIFNSAP